MNSVVEEQHQPNTAHVLCLSKAFLALRNFSPDSFNAEQFQLAALNAHNEGEKRAMGKCSIYRSLRLDDPQLSMRFSCFDEIALPRPPGLGPAPNEFLPVLQGIALRGFIVRYVYSISR